MSGNTFGKIFKVTTFGESHGKALGCIIDGCPPNLKIDESDIQRDLDRRKPAPISTPFTAFIDIIPCANNASNLSNTGSPNPIGIFLPIIVTLAPIESPDFLIPVKYSSSI